MRIGVIALIGTLGLGCSDSGTQTDDGGGGGGRCGAVTTHSLSLSVTVEDAGGAPVSDAAVQLEERAWEPGTLGSGTTDGSGVARLADVSITGVEDCWGVALDYVLVVEKDALRSETQLNSSLFNAVSSGQTELDRSVTLQ